MRSSRNEQSTDSSQNHETIQMSWLDKWGGVIFAVIAMAGFIVIPAMAIYNDGWSWWALLWIVPVIVFVEVITVEWPSERI